MIIYISGSISNCIDTYKSKFEKAKMFYEGQGHIVINPAVLPVGLDKSRYMPVCFAMIDSADAISMIGDDWQNSKGAVLEKLYAEYQGKKVIYLQ